MAKSRKPAAQARADAPSPPRDPRGSARPTRASAPARPRLSGQLPDAKRQEGAPQIPRPGRTITIPVIRPQESAQNPAQRIEMLIGPIPESQRRWGVHQQSLKQAREEQRVERKEGARPGGTGASTTQTESGNAKSGAKAKKEAASGAPTGPITRQTLIMDIVSQYPDALPVLIDAGLHCIGCQLAAYDTLEAGCAIHGFDDAMIDKLVEGMNRKLAQTADAQNATSSSDKQD